MSTEKSTLFGTFWNSSVSVPYFGSYSPSNIPKNLSNWSSFLLNTGIGHAALLLTTCCLVDVALGNTINKDSLTKVCCNYLANQLYCEGNQHFAMSCPDGICSTIVTHTKPEYCDYADQAKQVLSNAGLTLDDCVTVASEIQKQCSFVVGPKRP